MSGTKDEYNPVAEEIPFDNDSNGFVSDNVQDAIEEINTGVQTTAAPGFSFGRKGNLATNTWLKNETVPSNKAGHTVNLTLPIIQEITVSSENIDTYDIRIYEHEGDEVNLTTLITVSIIAKRGDTFTGLAVNITAGRQLAARVVNGTARNAVVDLVIKGTI